MPIDFDTLVPEESLDCLGELCPMPIIRAAGVVRRLAGGALVAVLSDDPGILVDMPAWCKSHSHEFVGASEGTHGDRPMWRVFVRKVAR